MPADFHTLVADIIEYEARPLDKYGHQPRLYELTRKIGEELTYDDDIVWAAAWIHDIGVFVGNRPEDHDELLRWDHVKYACDRATALLREVGFPSEKIPAVLDAIRTHQPQNDPRTIEATILRDADILEQLGAIGIMRAASKVGRDSRYARFSDIAPVLKKALTDLPPKLRLKRAHELSVPKIRILADFLEALDAEASGSLF